ncbi:hypothetical protein Tco_0626116 [Tanacetum coccineum]|uniref:Uncharacterized protein n=1 Tax=Tanacetum coccineum TaxID=301880 RepID=A0ABQ4WIU6_9ASTR
MLDLCVILFDRESRSDDAYHNLQDDDIMKNIFNSGRNKNKVGMRIPAWMITDEMKLTEHYKMYAEVFGLDVPLTQSQPTESTQGTHRTTSAPRQSARLTPPVPVPTAEKADEMILQDTIQVSLAEHKSREEQEARENVALVDEHLAAEEIEKLVENPENVDDREGEGTKLEETRIFTNSLTTRSPRILSTPIFDTEETPELKGHMVTYLHISKKEKVIKQVNKEVPAQVRDQVPVYLAEGLILERKTNKEETERLISKAILQERGSMQAHISSHIQNAIDNAIPSLVDASADPLLQQQDIAIWLAFQMKFEKTQVPQTACRSSAFRTRDQDDPHDDAHPEGENSAKRQKTSEYEAYVSGESSSGQVNVEEPGPSTSGNQEQDDEFDF